jgi:Transglycosylase SLT domain
MAACLAAGLIASCATPPPPAARADRASAKPTFMATQPAITPARTPRPVSRLPVVSGNPARLAARLTTAEAALSGGGAPPGALVRQALIVQLTCLKLAGHPALTNRVIAAVPQAWRAAAAADIRATADLVALTTPEPRLPPWRIVPAASEQKLRADYRAAQAASGVNWSYLAAINFVETDFGRIVGPSTAGAQGPMQFMPATWAIYGHGDIRSPWEAIMAAARLLRDRGGATAIGPALYAYNPSRLYVAAVRRYARRLRADPAALTSYYRRQILCHLSTGWVWLPAGYGAGHTVHAVRVHL